MTRHYSAEIKEKLNDHVLTPSYHGSYQSVEDLIKLWGLREPDIEWYRLYETDINGNIIIELK